VNKLHHFITEPASNKLSQFPRSPQTLSCWLANKPRYLATNETIDTVTRH